MEDVLADSIIDGSRFIASLCHEVSYVKMSINGKIYESVVSPHLSKVTEMFR